MADFISMSEANYTLKKVVGSLCPVSKDGVDKRVTLGYWNGEMRLDIRRWQDGINLGKGITLNEAEVRELRKILANTDFGR